MKLQCRMYRRTYYSMVCMEEGRMISAQKVACLATARIQNARWLPSLARIGPCNSEPCCFRMLLLVNPFCTSRNYCINYVSPPVDRGAEEPQVGLGIVSRDDSRLRPPIWNWGTFFFSRSKIVVFSHCFSRARISLFSKNPDREVHCRRHTNLG